MRVAGVMLLLGLMMMTGAAKAQGLRLSGPRLFNSYVSRYVSQEGRVIDRSHNDMRTTSEGQAYAMRFALEYGREALFESLWRWTRQNLMPGKDVRLPAWLWGRRRNGSWGIEDTHSASDADLWMATDLIRAGKRWGKKAWTLEGDRLLTLIRKKEVVHTRRGEPLLLPGDKGFIKSNGYVVNLSYWPASALDVAARAQPGGPWAKLLRALPTWIAKSAPEGFVPDWMIVTKNGRVEYGDGYSATGSYDAIRVYLWAALAKSADITSARAIERHLFGPRHWPEKNVPEKVNVRTGRGHGQAPIGFDAVWARFLEDGRPKRAARLWRKVDSIVKDPAWENDGDHYYDYNLVLWAISK